MRPWGWRWSSGFGNTLWFQELLCCRVHRHLVSGFMIRSEPIAVFCSAARSCRSSGARLATRDIYQKDRIIALSMANLLGRRLCHVGDSIAASWRWQLISWMRIRTSTTSISPPFKPRHTRKLQSVPAGTRESIHWLIWSSSHWNTNEREIHHTWQVARWYDLNTRIV